MQSSTRPPADLITVSRAAELLGVRKTTIYNYLSAGKLRGFKLAGYCWRISEEQVKELLQPAGPRAHEPMPETRGERERRHRDAAAKLKALGYKD